MSMKSFFPIAVIMGIEGLMAQQILTDAEVVKMAQAGVAQDIILKLIAESPVQFGLQADHVIAWKNAGVPDEVMRAMVTRGRETPLIRYTHFSSEVRVIPAKHGKKGLARLKIW